MAAKACSACSVLISFAEAGEDGDDAASKDRAPQARTMKPEIRMLKTIARVAALIVAPALIVGFPFHTTEELV